MKLSFVSFAKDTSLHLEPLKTYISGAKYPVPIKVLR